MKIAVAILAVALVGAILGGCAYKPLKAPCSPDEGGTPMAYSEMPTLPQPPAFKSLDGCGPMQPI